MLRAHRAVPLWLAIGLVAERLLRGGDRRRSPGASEGGGAGASATGADDAAVTSASSTGGANPGGGGGGSAPCDGSLVFDGDDLATVAYHADLDPADDFAWGAWVWMDPDPAYAAPGDKRSRFVTHARYTPAGGYSVGAVEISEDGLPRPVAFVFVGGMHRDVIATEVIPWSTWTHVAGSYRRDAGSDDLTVWVSGAAVASRDLGDLSVDPYAGALEPGGTAELPDRFLLGRLDDVFVKRGAAIDLPIAPPATCSTDFVLAVGFDGTFGSSCAAPQLDTMMGLAPADPEPSCAM